MLGDSSEIEDGRTLACDVCIVGGGPAGITVALALAGGTSDVVLLESGGLRAAPETQRLYDGEVAGIPRPPTSLNRVRMLGGSSGHWTGMCRPLEPYDFDHRPWVPHSGWPISREELDPYYVRAHDLCELGPYDYTPARWPGLLTADPGLARMDTELRLLQVSPPTRFGQRFRSRLRKAPRLRVLLDSTVTEVVPKPGGRVIDRVEVRSLAGKRFDVRARAYVIACGGIENARLLLLSNRVARAGLGNDGDWVGRCFMDHPGVRPLGLFQFLRPEAHRLSQTQPSPVEKPRRVMVGVGLGFETQRSDELLNGILYVGRPMDLSRLRGDPPDERTPRFLQRVSTGTDAVEIALCWLRCEQAPNPGSRVALSDEVDALGQRRVRVEWRLTDLDYRSFRRSARRYVRAVGAAGLARIQLSDWMLDALPDWQSRVLAGPHHMGTTRMATSPAQGVVDRDCKVFGVENLFMAGSSVFATCGFANPTLTIVALAQRLGEHLRRRT